MMNLYLAQDALGTLANMDFGIENTPYRDATIDITDLPVTGVITVEEGVLDVKVYLRDEMKTNTRIYAPSRHSLGCYYMRGDFLPDAPTATTPSPTCPGCI